jgi:uncharacterized protein (DUF1800 family)
MNKTLLSKACIAALTFSTLTVSGWSEPSSPQTSTAAATATSNRLPYQQAGLSDRQAAALLLRRLTFGPRPGDIEELLKIGIEPWLEAQLQGKLADPELADRLESYPALALSTGDQRSQYINYGQLVNFGKMAGVLRPENPTDEQQQEYNKELTDYRKKHSIKLLDDLFDELRSQKLVRGIYARNQLREVLVDFWFNHFNVNANEGNVRQNALDYEEQALRPHALGRFSQLLAATSKHPAMLYYLNNAQSYATPGVETKLELSLSAIDDESRDEWRTGQPGKRKSGGGLNENYAREILELHTLGVDGGYTQKDVTELARVLTGWGVLYPETGNFKLRRQVDGKEKLGYQWKGDFLFRADLHDATPKKVLDIEIPAGGGVEEGERVIAYLAEQKATARFVSRKLAQRFVSDQPSDALVDLMANRFLDSKGDIPSVLREMLANQEFWSQGQQLVKLRSPFEMVCAVLRASKAEVKPTRNLIDWVSRLGEPLYQCAPPTGYPERSQAWVSPGMMVNRLNFVQAAVQGRVQGVTVPVDEICPASLSPQESADVLCQTFLPELELAPQSLSKITAIIQEPGDGYGEPRNWFQPTTPQRFETKRSLAWRKRMVAATLSCPDFQRR